MTGIKAKYALLEQLRADGVEIILPRDLVCPPQPSPPPDDLRDRLKEAFQRDGPSLIDALIDGAIDMAA